MSEPSYTPPSPNSQTGANRWRWGMICVATGLVLIVRPAGTASFAPWIILYIAALGVSANLALSAFLGRKVDRVWHSYAACFVDVLLMGGIVVYLGPHGSIIVMGFAVLPHAFRPTSRLAFVSLASSLVVYAAALGLNGVIVDGSSNVLVAVTPRILLETGLFTGFVAILILRNRNTFRRFDKLRSLLEDEASLSVKECETDRDILGKLEQSLGVFLESASSSLAAVSNTAEGIAAAARTTEASAATLADRTEAAIAAAQKVEGDFKTLESLLDSAKREGEETLQNATARQTRDKSAKSRLKKLVDSTESGTKKIGKTADDISAIGAEIREASEQVEHLGGLARQIASSAISIAKVARHTHVLALNAAIEAARAKEHGREFAVVADQVRSLAGEASKSARAVGELVDELENGIQLAARAMANGEHKLTEMSVVANEARSNISELGSDVEATGELVVDVDEETQSRVELAHSLSAHLSELASMREGWTSGVEGTLETLQSQKSALEAIQQECKQILTLTHGLNGDARSRSQTTSASTEEE